MSDWKLISTANPSGAANVEFTDLTGYKIFKFVCIDINPATDAAEFEFSCSVSGSYGTTKTTISFETYHDEADTSSGLVLSNAAWYLAQSTSNQVLMGNMGNGADECGSSEMYLYNPASTTYVKHFYNRSQYYQEGNYSYSSFASGYLNTTSALDGIKFLMSSGNFDGTIKQYGLVAG